MKYPLILLALSACAHAQTPAPNPLDPHAPVPAIKHDSPLAGYRAFDDAAPSRREPEASVADPATPHHHPH